MTPLIETIRTGALRPTYRRGTHCPECGASAWTVGRFSAECARCGTALPFAPEARIVGEDTTWR